MNVVKGHAFCHSTLRWFKPGAAHRDLQIQPVANKGQQDLGFFFETTGFLTTLSQRTSTSQVNTATGECHRSIRPTSTSQVNARKANVIEVSVAFVELTLDMICMES